jgi:hypothetical protein
VKEGRGYGLGVKFVGKGIVLGHHCYNLLLKIDISENINFVFQQYLCITSN